MFLVRKSAERGTSKIDWLDSKHTFSFADYYDEKFMGFGVLRVINEDRIKGGTGFGTHGHKDMEIISYVIHGGLKHKDSMGNETFIKPGEVQRMSAGTGVRHSEFNAYDDQETHFLQIWILPAKMNIPPSYEQKSFKNKFSTGGLVQVVSKNGENETISINQDFNMYVAQTTNDQEEVFKTTPERRIWIQLINGHVKVGEEFLLPGDGIGLAQVESVKIKWSKDSQFILMEM